jgi:hypothetical protein
MRKLIFLLIFLASPAYATTLGFQYTATVSDYTKIPTAWFFLGQITTGSYDFSIQHNGEPFGARDELNPARNCTVADPFTSNKAYTVKVTFAADKTTTLYVDGSALCNFTSITDYYSASEPYYLAIFNDSERGDYGWTASDFAYLTADVPATSSSDGNDSWWTYLLAFLFQR